MHQAEATAPIVAFDLAYHNIEVSLLVFRPASDMRTVQENRQRRRRFGGWRNKRLVLLAVADLPGNSTQSIAHRCVHLLRARQKGFQDTRRFPEGMTRPKFGLKT